MQKQISFAVVAIISILILSACIPPLQPSPPQGELYADPYYINPCISMVDNNLYKAAQSYPGDLFWEFFVNFRVRTLGAKDENNKRGLLIWGCLRLYDRDNNNTPNDTSDDTFVPKPLGIIPISCYWKSTDYKMKRAEWESVLGQFLDYNNTMETSLNSNSKSGVSGINLSSEDSIVCPIDLGGDHGVLSTSYPYLTIVALGDDLLPSDSEAGNLFRYQPNENEKPDVELSVTGMPRRIVLSADFNGDVVKSCELQVSEPTYLWVDVEPSQNGTAPPDHFKWKREGASNNSPATCPGSPTLDRPVKLDNGSATITIGGGLKGTLYEIWFDPDDMDRK